MDDGNTDAEAVARVLAGDVDAFRDLVNRYGDGLYRFCRARLGSADDAEDAVQDVFTRAFRSLARFDARRGFPAWLFAIAANRVKSRYAARAAIDAVAEAAAREAGSADDSEDAEAEALDSLAGAAVRAAVARLPARLRVVVELYYFAGLSVAETAAAAGLGREAVKSRLLRARRRLSVELDPGPQPSAVSKGSS